MWGRLPTCGRLPIGLVDLRRLGRVVPQDSVLGRMEIPSRTPENSLHGVCKLLIQQGADIQP
jgi:hypothetical protein